MSPPIATPIHGFAAAFLLATALPANSVVVTPTVGATTAAAVTANGVPFYEPALDEVLIAPGFDFDIQNAPVTSASVSLIGDQGGAETADGAAQVNIDTTDINASTVRARSRVDIAGGSPAPLADARTTDGSIGALQANLSTAGLAPGDTASVNLQLNVTGSLFLTDTTGTAGFQTVVDPFDPLNTQDVPDMSANVSVVFSLADVSPIVVGPIPDPLPFAALFNGSITLRSTTPGAAPELVREGDWADAARDGDFSFVGPCNEFGCQVDIAMSIPFSDVQSLGFGENFDLGLVLLTNADSTGAAGRSAGADFFNTAGFDVSFTVVPAASTPAPGSALLLALALPALMIRRRANARGAA